MHEVNIGDRTKDSYNCFHIILATHLIYNVCSYRKTMCTELLLDL